MDLTIFLCLLWKHAFIDIGVQRTIKNLDKYNYWSPKGFYHYGGHGVFTMLVFFMFTGPLTAIIAGLLDFLAHWHIDYTKSQIMMRWHINSTHQSYWWLLTIDQMLHYLTYYVIILLI